MTTQSRPSLAGTGAEHRLRKPDGAPLSVEAGHSAPEDRTRSMLSHRMCYRRRASEAAGYERLKCWVAAAAAWEAALSFATGANVYWCRSRQAWCLARSRKG